MNPVEEKGTAGGPILPLEALVESKTDGEVGSLIVRIAFAEFLNPSPFLRPDNTKRFDASLKRHGINAKKIEAAVRESFTKRKKTARAKK